MVGCAGSGKDNITADPEGRPLFLYGVAARLLSHRLLSLRWSRNPADRLSLP